MSRDSVSIKADDHRTVYVDQFDGKVWLSIAINGGSAYCTIQKDEAIRMVAVLQGFIGELENTNEETI
jgi:hypothetical protein